MVPKISWMYKVCYRFPLSNKSSQNKNSQPQLMWVYFINLKTKTLDHSGMSANGNIKKYFDAIQHLSNGYEHKLLDLRKANYSFTGVVMEY